MKQAQFDISQYLEVLLEAICVVDKHGVFISVSPGCERLFGYKPEEMVGRPMISMVHPDDRERTLKAAGEIMQGDYKIDFENRYIRKDGSVVDILWSAQWSAADQVRVAVARDVTQTKQMLQRLQDLAFFDPLTGLPNRHLFADRFTMALNRAKRELYPLAVLFIDLDKLKQVNDSVGHAQGDQLLCQVARRLQTLVRDTDTVARFGGDEFVILLDRMGSSEQALLVAEKVHQRLAQPLRLEGHEFMIPASIGVAFYPDHGQHEQTLLACADAAMYRAKQAGGGRTEIGDKT